MNNKIALSIVLLSLLYTPSMYCMQTTAIRQLVAYTYKKEDGYNGIIYKDEQDNFYISNNSGKIVPARWTIEKAQDTSTWYLIKPGNQTVPLERAKNLDEHARREIQEPRPRKLYSDAGKATWTAQHQAYIAALQQQRKEQLDDIQRRRREANKTP